MINHQTAGGKQGYSLIVDEFTKYIDVKLITRKNEMQDHIKEFVMQMEATGHHVKWLCMDFLDELQKIKGSKLSGDE